MRKGDAVYRNPYSLMSSPLDPSRYSISVLRVAELRGGSVHMHENVEVGEVLEISDPLNLFPIAHTARKHILIAGGIGITPFMAMLAQFRNDKSHFELHYAVSRLKTGHISKHWKQKDCLGSVSTGRIGASGSRSTQFYKIKGSERTSTCVVRNE